MRRVGIVAGCVGLAMLASGCTPAERRYVNEGAGVDLYTAESATQAELLREYIAYVCQQVGADQPCVGNWTTFVQAGMNDIDQRCDGFLTWLDARRRDKEPVLAEMAALTAAAHSIMTVTGASPKSLDILTAAFGLAAATYTNWNSRLLISVNQSTVQEVVYGSQGQFREKIRDYRVPDQPAAIYLLRNYLRLCMPITIEATFNTSTTLVQRGPATAAAAATQGNMVVANVMPTRRFAPTFTSHFGPDATTAVIRKWLLLPDGSLDREHRDILREFLRVAKPNLEINPFLKGTEHAALRLEFARRQGLIP
jgi:hypothetical protein